MNYFSAHYAVKKIGRGGFPQSQDIEMEPGRMVTDDDFVWNLQFDKLPDFNPYIGTLILQDGSILTDFISSAIISVGFVCSEKVKKIVEKQKTTNLRFYNLSVKHKNIYYNNYYLMHSVNNYDNKVDFESSVFQIFRIENNSWFGKNIILKDFDEYTKLIKELSNNKYGDWQKIEAKEIRFKNNFKPEHNIFNLFGINSHIYFSEQLKKDLDENKITGIQYNADDIITEFK